MTIYSYNDKICFNLCEGTNADKYYGTKPVDKDKKRRLRMQRNWLIASVILFFASAVIGSGMENELRTFFHIVFALSFFSLIAAIIVKIVSWFAIVKKDRNQNVMQSKRYLENTSEIFRRKSAKADPTK